MADYDSALPVRGNVEDGASIYSQNTVLIIGGSDGTNYQQLNVDTSGAVNVVGRVADGEAITGDPLTNGGLFETDGGSAVDSGDITYLALDAYGRTIVVGQTADGDTIDANAFPVLMAGQDGTNVQSLLTDTSGRLIVNVGGGTQAGITYGTANLVKDTVTDVVTVSDMIVKRIYVAGSELMKVEVFEGATASETLKFVQFNSTANPNVLWDFTSDGWKIVSANSLIVKCTNLENASSPTSDFAGYGTIVEEVGI